MQIWGNSTNKQQKFEVMYMLKTRKLQYLDFIMTQK